MITIDKTDKLYKFLLGLGVKDVEDEYLTLAKNGRFKIQDIRAFYQASLQPSLTNEIPESELEKIVDFYKDIKKKKSYSSKELNNLLTLYKQTNNKVYKEQIINSELKNVLHTCLNFKSSHPEVDLQDLLQIASMGLITAVEKFNPQAKISFSDYELYWIRNQILNEFKGGKNE